MFNPQHYDEVYRRQNVTVALTVFAVGRYLDIYLEKFLSSAEQHFMVGQRVIYYVFTDDPDRVPQVKLSAGRSVTVIKVLRHSRWQDVFMLRMKTIADTIDSLIRHQAQPKFFYTLDHNPKSAAYVEQGDMYYHAAVFGGTWQQVKTLTQSCYWAIMQDKNNQVEALWHDESHLNKYFWLHKPTKVLSPEYCWASAIGYRSDIHVVRLVWAEKQYLDIYLEKFLSSAEQHFMVGQRVIYYVFTDDPDRVPQVKLSAGRSVTVIKVLRHSRWQDVSMLRMKTIADTIDSLIRHQAQYVFCLDVDQEFVVRFGTEALGDLVALFHSYYYRRPKFFYTLDHNPKSAAYVEQGDMYYHAAVFGGTWQQVKTLTQSCYWAIMQDKNNQVEALWHDESHLNKYFWLHKPTKVLSPEYCWASAIGYRSDIHVVRLVWAEKQYSFVRQ
ncbi:UNVERIFIED_CONTAM: hypothetical protein FKN15_070251 [Acipenser sinensis]